MKKIFSIITIITALFLILSCGANLHNAEVMHVDKVVVEGLTDLAGKEMGISGNFIPNAEGEVNLDDWFHATGDSSVLHKGAVATVNSEGTITFNLNILTSEATLKFLGKSNVDGWIDAERFGKKAYVGGFGSEAELPNAFTGSDKPKIIFGRVGAGNVIDWSIVDKIPAPVVADSVFIAGVELANVSGVSIDPSADHDVYFLNAWLPGNEWNATTPNCADFDGEGTATRMFAEPVEFTEATIAVQIRMMVTPGPVNFWDGAGNKPNNSAANSIANPKDGKTYLFSYDFSTNTVSLIEQ